MKRKTLSIEKRPGLVQISLSRRHYGIGVLSFLLLDFFLTIILYYILGGGHLFVFRLPIFLICLAFFAGMIFFQRSVFRSRTLQLQVKGDKLHCNDFKVDLRHSQVSLNMKLFRGETLISADGLLLLVVEGKRFQIGNTTHAEAEAVRLAIEELLTRPIDVKISDVL